MKWTFRVADREREELRIPNEKTVYQRGFIVRAAISCKVSNTHEKKNATNLFGTL
jgi:hypothetical protein